MNLINSLIIFQEQKNLTIYKFFRFSIQKFYRIYLIQLNKIFNLSLFILVCTLIDHQNMLKI